MWPGLLGGLHLPGVISQIGYQAEVGTVTSLFPHLSLVPAEGLSWSNLPRVPLLLLAPGRCPLAASLEEGACDFNLSSCLLRLLSYTDYP